MAIIKHIKSKNINYSTALEYLMFQHDEITNKPILDDFGGMIYRDEYYIDGLNCTADTFDVECQTTN